MTKATPSFWQSSVPPEQRQSTGYCNELLQLAQFYKDAQNKNKSLIYNKSNEYQKSQSMVNTLFKNAGKKPNAKSTSGHVNFLLPMLLKQP